MKYPYQAAVIGLGKIGSFYPSDGVSRTHMDAYTKNKRIDVIAGVDPNKKAQKYFLNRWKQNIPVFSTVKEMLFKLSPDIVSVCAPTYRLIEIIKDFSKKPPKLFFLEKPVSDDFDSSKKIFKLIKNIPVAVNYHRCWDPSHLLFFKKVLNSGKVISISIKYNKGMFNYSSHIIALLIYHFGSVIDLKELESQNYNIKNSDPSYSFILNFKYGIQAIFQGFDNIKYDLLELEILTTKGIFSIKSAGCRKRVEKPKKNVFYPNYIQLDDVHHNEKDGQVRGLSQAVNNIINFLDGKDKKLSCNLGISLEVSNIMCKIQNKNKYSKIK